MPLKNEKKRKKVGKSGRNPKMYYSQENIFKKSSILKVI